MYAKWKYEGEDKILYYKDKEFNFSILADGHGGDFVSSYIKNNFVRKFYDKLKRNEELKTTIKKTLNQISDEMKTIEEGSTIVGIVSNGKDAVLFNIGDSRCYGLLKNNKLKQLTTDHNLYNRNEIKRLNYKVVDTDDERRLDGVLMMTRSIGDSDVKNVSSKPSITNINLQDYKYLLLLSDGVYDTLQSKQIENVIIQNKNIIKSLLKLSETSDDDRSILLLKIK